MEPGTGASGNTQARNASAPLLQPPFAGFAFAAIAVDLGGDQRDFGLPQPLRRRASRQFQRQLQAAHQPRCGACRHRAP